MFQLDWQADETRLLDLEEIDEGLQRYRLQNQIVIARLLRMEPPQICERRTAETCDTVDRICFYMGDRVFLQLVNGLFTFIQCCMVILLMGEPVP